MVYDPAALALSGWWRASYAGSPWVAVASAGGSGSNGNMTEATNPPSVGASLNGLASADFDGTNDRLGNANDVTVFLGLSSTAYSISCVIAADAAATRSVGAAYSDAAILTDDTNGFFCLTFTSDGVTMMHYDGTFSAEATQACAADGNPHTVHAWYDGTNINVSVDGAAAATDAAGTGYNTANALLRMGVNYNAGARFNGRIWDIMTAASNLGPTARTNIESYFQATYILPAGDIIAALAGSATGTGSLTGDGVLAAVLSGSGAIGALLTGDGALASVMDGTCSTSAAVTGSGALACAIAGTSTCSGTVTAIGASVRQESEVAAGVRANAAVVSGIRHTSPVVGGVNATSVTL